MKDNLLELEHKSKHVSFIDKRTESSEVSRYQSKTGAVEQEFENMEVGPHA